MDTKTAFIIKIFIALILLMELSTTKSFSYRREEESSKAIFIFRESGKNQFNELYIYEDFSYVYYKIYDSKEFNGNLSDTEQKQLSEILDKYDEITWSMNPGKKGSKTPDSWSLWGFGKKQEIDNGDKEKMKSIADALIKTANDNMYKYVSGDIEEENRDSILVFRETGTDRNNKLYISKSFSFTYYELLFNREYKGYLSEDEEKQLSEIVDKYEEIHWSTTPAGEKNDGVVSWSLWGLGKKKEIDNEDKEKLKSMINLLIENVTE